MIHSNIFTLPRPIVCLDPETEELFLKTGSLIFSETYTGKDKQKHSDVFSERPIDEYGNIRVLLDNHTDFGEPFYLGFPGQTISPFSHGFVESLKVLNANIKETHDFVEKLRKFGIEVDKNTVLDNPEILFRFKNEKEDLYVEADSITKNDPSPVPFDYSELVKETEGHDIAVGLYKALVEFYSIFRKPKTITIKAIYTICESEFKEEIEEIVNEFVECIKHMNEKGNELNTGIEFIIKIEE